MDNSIKKPYDPKVLQDAQDILEAERRRFYEERTRAFVETLTPEEQREHDAYNNAIQKRKDELGIGNDVEYATGTKSYLARRLGVDRKTLYRWIKSGKICVEEVSRQRWRIRESELKRLSDSDL